MTNTNQQEQLYSRQDVINAWNSAYGGDRYLSGEQYVDDLLPTPPVEDGKQGGEYCKEDLNTAYVAGVSEGMTASGSFEWGTRRKDISFDDWFKDDFEPSQPSTPVQGEWVKIEDGLPSKAGKYIVYGRYAADCPMNVFQSNFYKKDKSFRTDIKTKGVTHWQPLPSPPVNKQD